MLGPVPEQTVHLMSTVMDQVLCKSHIASEVFSSVAAKSLNIEPSDSCTGNGDFVTSTRLL